MVQFLRKLLPPLFHLVSYAPLQLFVLIRMTYSLIHINCFEVVLNPTWLLRQIAAGRAGAELLAGQSQARIGSLSRILQLVQVLRKLAEAVRTVMAMESSVENFIVGFGAGSRRGFLEGSGSTWSLSKVFAGCRSKCKFARDKYEEEAGRARFLYIHRMDAFL